jgi:hypothetical protein
MAIQNKLLTATNQLVFPASADNLAITTIIVCNTVPFNPALPTADQEDFYLYAVPAGEVSGTTTTAKHTIVNGLPIPAGETVSLDQEKMVLAAGDVLIAKGSSTNLAITVSTLTV